MTVPLILGLTLVLATIALFEWLRGVWISHHIPPDVSWLIDGVAQENYEYWKSQYESLAAEYPEFQLTFAEWIDSEYGQEALQEYVGGYK